MAKVNYDIVILGGGPGGYVAAIRAAQLGLNVAVVESNHMGGICLNWGCIPTKALLRSAEVYHLMQNADKFGLSAKNISFDFDKVIQRSRQVSQQLSSGISHLMKKNKIKVYEGYGKLNGKGNIKVESDGKKIADLSYKNLIIATGAKARELAEIKPDGDKIVTYKDAMTPKKMPKSLLVIGSGAIGVEFASFYHNMGCDVTIIEIADRILPVEDTEISSMAQKIFEKQGIKIKTSTSVSAVKVNKSSVNVTLQNDNKKSNIEVEKVIIAAGIIPNSNNLGLEGTKVKFNKGHIKTDQWNKTGEDNIYAIGDVTAPPWLAHKASHEAILCVEKIAGLKNLHPIKIENIPGCTYCMPQIASVGLTEDKAKQLGKKIKIGRFPYFGNGKAIAMGEDEGLIKTIFDADSSELLGVHMIGAEVTELIAGFLVGKTMEATELDFMHTIFPHPTLSEMMHEAVLDAFDRTVHM